MFYSYSKAWNLQQGATELNVVARGGDLHRLVCTFLTFSTELYSVYVFLSLGDGQVGFEEFVTLLGPKLSSVGMPDKFHGADFDSIFWKVLHVQILMHVGLALYFLFGRGLCLSFIGYDDL